LVGIGMEDAAAMLRMFDEVARDVW